MTDHAFSPPSAASFLSVGLPLQLCFADQSHQTQYGSSLLGWKSGDWLICEWPYHLGEPVACRIHDACLVRYMFNGRFIGYPSVIRNQQLEPFPFLFLAFPQTVEEVNLRKHARVFLKEPWPVKIEEAAGQASRLSGKRIIGGMIHDLSLTGCCAAIPRDAASWVAGTTLRLEFELNGVGHITNLAALIKNTTPFPDHIELGIEFVFTGMEFIEYRGWGGTVRHAIECCVLQKSAF